MDRFNKVWAEIVSYFTSVVDFIMNLLGMAKKDDDAEGAE